MIQGYGYQRFWAWVSGIGSKSSSWYLELKRGSRLGSV